MSEENIERIKEKLTDPKIVDWVFWLGVPLGLLLIAYLIYRWWKTQKEAKK